MGKRFEDDLRAIVKKHKDERRSAERRVVQQQEEETAKQEKAVAAFRATRQEVIKPLMEATSRVLAEEHIVCHIREGDDPQSDIALEVGAKTVTQAIIFLNGSPWVRITSGSKREETIPEVFRRQPTTTEEIQEWLTRFVDEVMSAR